MGNETENKVKIYEDMQKWKEKYPPPKKQTNKDTVEWNKWEKTIAAEMTNNSTRRNDPKCIGQERVTQNTL